MDLLYILVLGPQMSVVGPDTQKKADRKKNYQGLWNFKSHLLLAQG